MMRSLAGLAVLSLSVLLVAQDPGTTYMFRFPAPLSSARLAALEATFDVGCGHAEPGDLRVYVLPGAEHDQFVTLYPEAVLVRRGRPFVAPGPFQIIPDANYYTTVEIVQELDALVTAYPTLARRVDLSALPGASQTHNGQSIWALVVSDNVAQPEDEPAIVIAAQHHARELNTPPMVIGAARRILGGYASDPALQALVDGYEVWFVPCVNPDGVDHVWAVDDMWRKNRRNNGSNYGVDLNRNYTTHWGQCGASTTTSSQTYRGPSAGSEPEVRTMRALTAAVRPEIYLDFHSSGREVLETYAPCAQPTATIGGLISHYVDDLRTPMAFNRRRPSASAEAPEDHWETSGALSLLSEISTSFQPVWSSTVSEEIRVWPGIRRVVTTWRPAVRGHVRSVRAGAPLEATITFTPNVFTYGERTMSRARDGRYGLWLPLGTWQVTWSAPGHDPVTRSVTVASYDNPITEEVELLPTFVPATLSKSGSDRIGTPVSLTYTAPGDAGQLFWIPLSLGTAPGVSLGSRTLPLNPDNLMAASLSLAPVLVGNIGALPGSASAVATFNIPNVPSIAGVSIWIGGLTFESGYLLDVKRWAPPIQLTFLP